MKAFTGINEEGQTVEVTHNDENTHFYVNGSRIKASLAIEMKERFEALGRTTVASDNLSESASDVIIRVANEKSTKQKVEILTNALSNKTIREELVQLLKWNRKSESAKGFTWKRMDKFIQGCEKKEDLKEALVNTNRSKDFRATHAIFITALNGEDGNTTRFEINTAEKFAVLSGIPIGKEEVYCDIISRKTKTGLSDQVINDLIA